MKNEKIKLHKNENHLTNETNMNRIIGKNPQHTQTHTKQSIKAQTGILNTFVVFLQLADEEWLAPSLLV